MIEIADSKQTHTHSIPRSTRFISHPPTFSRLTHRAQRQVHQRPRPLAGVTWTFSRCHWNRVISINTHLSAAAWRAQPCILPRHAAHPPALPTLKLRKPHGHPEPSQFSGARGCRHKREHCKLSGRSHEHCQSGRRRIHLIQPVPRILVHPVLRLLRRRRAVHISDPTTPAVTCRAVRRVLCGRSEMPEAAGEHQRNGLLSATLLCCARGAAIGSCTADEPAEPLRTRHRGYNTAAYGWRWGCRPESE